MLQQKLSTASPKIHDVCYGMGWDFVALGTAIHCLFLPVKYLSR